MIAPSNPQLAAAPGDGAACATPDARRTNPFPQAAALDVFVDTAPYCGWRLETREYPDGDHFTRYWREAVYLDGHRVALDFTDFEALTTETFRKLVDLGLPRRADLGMSGPLRTTDVDAAHMARMKGAGATVALGVTIFLAAAYLLTVLPLAVAP